MAEIDSVAEERRMAEAKVSSLRAAETERQSKVALFDAEIARLELELDELAPPPAPAAAGSAQQLKAWAKKQQDVCRACGCSDEEPCRLEGAGQCIWNAPGFCSLCAEIEEAILERLEGGAVNRAALIADVQEGNDSPLVDKNRVELAVADLVVMGRIEARGSDLALVNSAEDLAATVFECVPSPPAFLPMQSLIATVSEKLRRQVLAADVKKALHELNGRVRAKKGSGYQRAPEDAPPKLESSQATATQTVIPGA